MKWMLIGGKSNGEILNQRIETILLEKTGKKCPKILYFPLASPDEEGSFLRFKTQMQGLNCKIAVLYSAYLNTLEQKVNEADILYFGGGITQRIVEVLKNYVSVILNSNKIIAGFSAGANMWTVAGMGDYYSYQSNFKTYNYRMVEGFKVLNMTFCPHYQHKDLIIYNTEVKNFDCDGFALENDTAIWLEDNQVTIYKADQRRSVYWFAKKKKYQMIPLYENETYEVENIL